VAIVGIGHELRGDDAAGIVAARELAMRLSPAGDWVRIIEAGPAPENVTGALRRFAPDLVVFIDAAEMGEAPGTVRAVPPTQAGGFAGSTHTTPIALLAAYLATTLGCEVALLGIQPAQDMIGASLSAAVRAAVGTVVAGLQAALEVAGSRGGIPGACLRARGPG
jgi:hydrogenase 3 maturation protease